MPRYLLHGGCENAPSPLNDALYDDIACRVPAGGVILMCYFAQEQPLWAKKFMQDKKRLERHLNGKQVHIYMAAVNHFDEAFAHADAVFFRGGLTSRLLAVQQQLPDLAKLLKNAGDKTIIGASAGVNLLAAAGLGLEGLNTGLGVVPAAVWVYADNPKYQPYGGDLNQHAAAASLPVIHLPEHQFVTREMTHDSY